MQNRGSVIALVVDARIVNKSSLSKRIRFPQNVSGAPPHGTVNNVVDTA